VWEKKKETNEKGKWLPPKVPWNCSSKQGSTWTLECRTPSHPVLHHHQDHLLLACTLSHHRSSLPTQAMQSFSSSSQTLSPSSLCPSTTENRSSAPSWTPQFPVSPSLQGSSPQKQPGSSSIPLLLSLLFSLPQCNTTLATKKRNKLMGFVLCSENNVENFCCGEVVNVGMCIYIERRRMEESVGGKSDGGVIRSWQFKYTRGFCKGKFEIDISCRWVEQKRMKEKLIGVINNVYDCKPRI